MASKATLKTNYKNDAYSGNRKFKMTNNSDGTVSFEDVTPYTQTEVKWYQEKIMEIVRGKTSITWLRLVYIYVKGLKK